MCTYAIQIQVALMSPSRVPLFSHSQVDRAARLLFAIGSISIGRPIVTYKRIGVRALINRRLRFCQLYKNLLVSSPP